MQGSTPGYDLEAYESQDKQEWTTGCVMRDTHNEDRQEK